MITESITDTKIMWLKLLLKFKLKYKMNLQFCKKKLMLDSSLPMFKSHISINKIPTKVYLQ